LNFFPQWSWPLTSSIVKIKIAWSYTSTPQYVFMMLYLIKQEINVHSTVLSYLLPYLGLST
jgi:hypothetical protein